MDPLRGLLAASPGPPLALGALAFCADGVGRGSLTVAMGGLSLRAWGKGKGKGNS